MIEMKLQAYKDYAEELDVRISDVIDKVDIYSDDYIDGPWCTWKVEDYISDEIRQEVMCMLEALEDGDELIPLYDEGIHDEWDYVNYVTERTNFGKEEFTTHINLDYYHELWVEGCEVIQDEFSCYSDFDPVCKFIANILEKMAHELYKNRISHIDWDRLNPIKDALIDINRQIQEAREYYESPEGEMEWNRHVALDLDLDNPLDVLNQLSLRDFSYSDERGLYVDDERRANYDYVGIDLSCLEKPQEKTKGR